MKMTIWFRLKLCYEILTLRSGHKHASFEKQLSTFNRGYLAGMKDAKLEHMDETEYERSR